MPARHSPYVVRFALLKFGGGLQMQALWRSSNTHISPSLLFLQAGNRMIHARKPGIGFRADLYFFRNSRDDHTLCHASRGLGLRGANSAVVEHSCLLCYEWILRYY